MVQAAPCRFLPFTFTLACPTLHTPLLARPGPLSYDRGRGLVYIPRLYRSLLYVTMTITSRNYNLWFFATKIEPPFLSQQSSRGREARLARLEGNNCTGRKTNRQREREAERQRDKRTTRRTGRNESQPRGQRNCTRTARATGQRAGKTTCTTVNPSPPTEQRTEVTTC